MTPKRIPTKAVVSSAEAVLSRQREISESTKDNVKSRLASTIQSNSPADSNLTKDERQALKRMKTDEDNVILPPEKGRVTVLWTRRTIIRQAYVGQLVLAKPKLVCVNETTTCFGKLLARNRPCLYSRQQFANMLLCRSHTPILVCQQELANVSFTCEGRFRQRYKRY